MDTATIDERQFITEFKANNHQSFYHFINSYEAYIAPIMRSLGYRCVNRSERTVLFTFGEVTFSRTRWYKGKKCRIPVDEKLGLIKNNRYSRELIYQIAELATMASYRQVVKIIELMYQIFITKDTVNLAVKQASKLLEEQKDYRFYAEEKQDKMCRSELIFLEGDGLFLKVQDKKRANGIELSRFVIHTGSHKISKNRYMLQNKKEISSTSNKEAREQVIDYIYNNFQITDDTILITNSDNGKGYSPYVFKEIACALKIKRHEHFWDRYHVNKEIKNLENRYGRPISKILTEAIDTTNTSKLHLAFDTMESLEESDIELEKLKKTRNRFTANLKYSRPALLRGLDKCSLGIIETQHRKISFRMKRRGMYWTKRGANTVSQMIQRVSEGKLRDLFFGSWREEYIQILGKIYQLTIF